ncbi:MAG: desulfoferrodoxin [Armatimonadia bacterium]|nr:desulfoferrodoxin [Armatimonadia bacterium]
MAEMNRIYKCEMCGIMIEVLHEGMGTLVCCNEEMELLDAATTDEGKEKHVPVIEKIDDGYRVTVGSVEHPMTEKHHIEWIELIADGKILRAHLDPTGEPTATFCTDAETVVARENCNLHGMWKAEG